jgi:glucosylceramidase
MSSHTSGTSKYQNNELAPLVDGIMRSNSARLSDHEVYDDEDIVSYRANTSKTRRWIALVGLTGLLVGMSMIIHSTLEDRRRHHEQAQEIVIAETRPVNPSGMEPEELPVPYRPMCKYYYHPEHHEETSTTATGETESLTLPRIIQTSMGNPSKPWSNVPCVRATNPEHVELNQYGAPDAILQVHFDDNNDLDFPPILGFGGAFTEASALNFQRLQPVGREAVLELLFGKTGLGYALGRVPIHSCDFTVESYSFAEIPEDLELLHFDKTLQHDVDAGMIDMIRGAQKKNQESWNDTNTDQRSLLRLFASPWSPPNWMKKPTWEDTPGAAHASKMTYSAFPNCLREGVGPDSQYAAAWAMYFSKYISAYAKYGIDFWAVTVQNEPEFAAPWEACAYTAANMTDFVAYHLGPTLAKHHPNVTILAFDHNKDHVVKWMEIMLNASDVLEDDETDDDDVAAVDVDKDTSRQSELPMSGDMAVPYIGGVAYHWYAGGK